MIHLLMIHNKGNGFTHRIQYESSAAALESRFTIEKATRAKGVQDDFEIVVLSGSSRSSMQRTHSKYFNRGRDYIRGRG